MPIASTNKANVLYIIGDPMVANVMEKCRDEVPLKPDWMEDDCDTSYTATVMLAPLPGKLSIIDRLTMKC